ncbi:MAG: UDP-N-acetylenolpyruvoylglucosamine reductase [candidate division TM6 bacterium GW2011_GWF2_32_72]|nr:MAG: UDP-N-acetylenolpyruvoylglucosamine reductase [candidate division TM6 bacterium GW2011_GWF2_32_72]
MNTNFIQQNIPLQAKNWFQTGGNAKFYCEPKNTIEFKEALEFAKTNNLSIFVLGKGANILISDDGFDGLVIRPQDKTISTKKTDKNEILVTASAGLGLDELIEYCLNNQILGLEEFSGIPATVGGATFINLHYFQFTLSNFLEKATLIDINGNIKEVPASWFEFGYDKSKLQNNDQWLVNATFRLKICTPEQAEFSKGRAYEIIRHRNARYPSTHTCGCFFRNFHPEEVSLESNGKKLIHVGYYLEQVGVKGKLQVGGAIVSWQHSNMIVNTGNSTSKDIIELAKQMQQLVFEKYKVLPQTECQLIGFNGFPLLKK